MRLENLYYRFSIDAGVKCTWEPHKKHLFQRGKLNAFKVSIQQYQRKGFCIPPCAPIKKINHFGFILPTKEIDLTIGCLPFHMHAGALWNASFFITLHRTLANQSHHRKACFLHRCKHFFFPENLAGHDGRPWKWKCWFCFFLFLPLLLWVIDYGEGFGVASFVKDHVEDWWLSQSHTHHAWFG